MAVANFVREALVEIEGREFKLLKQVDKGLWQLEDQRNGRLQEYGFGELQHKYVNNELIFVNDAEFHLDKKQAEISRKRNEVAMLKMDADQIKALKQQRAYVFAVESLPVTAKVLKKAIIQVWEKLGSQGKPPHWNTVARWKLKYQNSGKEAHVLSPKNHRKGNRVRRYPDEVLRIIEESVDEVYLTRERNSVKRVLNKVIVEVENYNKELPAEMQLKVPGLGAVQNAIDAIDAFDVYAARYGQLMATRKFRGVLHMQVTERPLQCAEIDHTLLDYMVVDGRTGRPWGRPWLTVCIDSNTRCILGIYIGFEPPSYLSVARCLKHVFMPKINLREIYPEIENEWLAHGLMEKLVVDNGLEFHGNSLESVCLALNIDLQFTPRKTPWWKGKVERVIGTINRGVAHGNPGTTFSNIFEKGDYDPVKNAVITLDALKLVLNKWICDVYHQRPHKSLDNVTPSVKWSSSIKPEEIMLPDNPARLDAILGSVEQRVLTHKGIEYLGLFYNSADLIDLRSRLGDTFKTEIRVDAGNLGHIYVISPDNSEVIKVPCLHQEYAAGLTRWQHEICKRYVRENRELQDKPSGWRHALEDISEIVLKEVFNGKKTKMHAKTARFDGENTRNIRTKRAEKPATPTTEIILNEVNTPPLVIKFSESESAPKKFVPILKSRKLN